jgi:hypothetical protein
MCPSATTAATRARLLAEFSVDSLLRYGALPKSARYAITMRDAGQVLAGTPLTAQDTRTSLLHWRAIANEYEVPVSRWDGC